MKNKQDWIVMLEQIYGDSQVAIETAQEIEKRFAHFLPPKPRKSWLTEKDSVLITYGDSILQEQEKSFVTLKRFLDRFVEDSISTIHILPMFPSSSDDGFSVINYKEINPDFGSWDDLKGISENYSMMFDAVVNHVSKESDWFKKFLNQEKPYTDFFIKADPNADYTSVTRPRMLPLLTQFETSKGIKHVWTTFSDDQVDLNYASPDVLIAVLDVLLFYVQQGARMIRLDAVGFLWKELGTTCMHLPQTHTIIKFMNLLLDSYAPGTLLITETNVPQKENLTYFGTHGDEAHLVYQFPLAPITMYCLQKGRAEVLSEWVRNLPAPQKGTTYFNFLSSHDGIGLRPLDSILPEEEKDFLVQATLKNGGYVSYKDNGDGTQSPYELNINYQDALSSPEESDKVRMDKLIASQTILLSLQGLPAIYIHSLLGSRNDYMGYSTSNIPRRINREKLAFPMLEESLQTQTNRKYIFDELLRRIRIRKEHSAFSPEASQHVLDYSEHVFSVLRKNEESSQTIYVLINVSELTIRIEDPSINGVDLILEETHIGSVVLEPLQSMWIVQQGEN
ncbi:MAG: sugar phosphorylase [Sphaerochaeta sp.]|nr:sugar phosphorylase [Sphaerochaeta sp.]